MQFVRTDFLRAGAGMSKRPVSGAHVHAECSFCGGSSAWS